MNVRRQVLIHFKDFSSISPSSSGWAECRVVSVQCTPGCGRLEAEELEARRPDLRLGPSVLWVTVSFLWWYRPQLRPPRPSPASLPSSSHLSRPGSVTATKIKQVFSYWSDPHHPASHCTDSSPCVQGSHWFIWSQVSALGQWQPASHCNTILSIRTAEKEHVGPQLSQVYKTMLLKFYSISKDYATKMTCKVILKPQWWSLVQNSVKRSNCCQVIFLRVLCQWWAVSAAVQTPAMAVAVREIGAQNTTRKSSDLKALDEKKWWILFLLNASSVVGCQKVIWWKHKFEETKQVL